MAKTYGDPSKLTADTFSRRAKRSVLRGDPKGTYKKGGKVTGGGATSKGTDVKYK